MCIGRCVIDIVRIGDTDAWKVRYFEGKTTDPIEAPILGRGTLIMSLQTALKNVSIEDGNAITFDQNKSNVIHWAVCVGRNQDGEIIVVHRGPGPPAEKPDWRSRFCSVAKLLGLIPSASSQPTRLLDMGGGIKKEKLSDVLEGYGSNLRKLEIYKCQTDMVGNLCRAASVHKALLAEGTPGYNPIIENCEHFAVACCSSYYLGSSQQAIEHTYFALIMLIATMIFLITLVYMASTGRSLRLAIAIPIFLASMFYLIFLMANQKIRAYILQRYQRRNLNKVVEFIEGSSEIELKAKAMIEKARAQWFNLEPLEKEMMQLEEKLLEYFYHSSQPVNSMICNDESKRKLVTDYVLHTVLNIYLLLKHYHITMYKNDLIYLPKCERSPIYLLKHLTIYLADLKTAELAARQLESVIDPVSPGSVMIDPKKEIYIIIEFLVAMFDPKKEGEQLWSVGNLSLAHNLCKEVEYWVIQLNDGLIEASENEFFRYLSLYWSFLSFAFLEGKIEITKGAFRELASGGFDILLDFSSMNSPDNIDLNIIRNKIELKVKSIMQKRTLKL